MKRSLFLVLMVASCRLAPEAPYDPFPTTAIDTTLEDGTRIRDLEVGSGIPADTGRVVTFHYQSFYNDSVRFESTYEFPPIRVELADSNLIPIWRTAMAGMRPGGKRELTVTVEAAYGPEGLPGLIPAGATLRYVIELLEAADLPRPWPVSPLAGKDLADGLRFFTYEPGNGPKPVAGQKITVAYSGYLPDGRLFDSSVTQGELLEVVLDQERLIRGWDRAIRDMREGEKRVVWMRSDWAFGRRGHPGIVEPDTDVRYDFHLIRIEDP